MINIAVIGFGVIGSGVVEIIEQNKNIISKEINEDINVKYILDIRDFSNHPMKDKFVSDFETILNDPEISVVAEMIGGQHPAYDYSAAAMKAGKSVVTSNKEVVAYRGAELLKIAAENGVSYLFEASVGGGIPIIRPLKLSLAGNRILSVNGILNGTTNYILTRMENDGKTMQEALSEAQAKGYAEANPSADINGPDTCRKICILAAMAFGKIVSPDKVSTTGITDITLRDINDAKKLGRAVKLLGRTEKLEDGRIMLIVAPFMVPQSNPISGIFDVFNGIMVDGESVGELMFYGKGAGKMPTASAVLSDIIEVVNGKTGELAWEVADDCDICHADEIPFEFYVRVNSDIDLKKFGWKKVSSENGEDAYITDKVLYSELSDKLQNNAPISIIRLY